ncbi:MAG: nucleoside triphosphate pyrophosphohydrolase [Chitinophagaceae bacterium]
MNTENKKTFANLVQIMNELREQCPWDKKQTIHTLRSMTIEETYELADAVLENNWNDIREELGDILLHILFYAKIASEENKFTIDDVIDGIANKLINRHPHIYGNVKVNDETDVKRNWEKIKLAEGKKSVLSGVPNSMSSLPKAICIQEKAKKVGFEWDNKEDVWKKVEEEMNELQEAVQSNNKQHIEEEFGDVFFSLLNYSRFLNVDADVALEKVNKKFIARFKKMEDIALEQGKHLSDMTLTEMDEIWNQVKKDIHC